MSEILTPRRAATVRAATVRAAILAAMLAVLPAAGWHGAGTAQAHAVLESSDPADGARLKAAPTRLALTFSAPVIVTSVQLVGPGGAKMAAERDTGLKPVRHLTLSFAPLPPGSYILDWRGQSEDGHPMAGSMSFAVEPE